MRGALDVAMALRTLGGESDPKILCFDVFWSGPKRLVICCFFGGLHTTEICEDYDKAV